MTVNFFDLNRMEGKIPMAILDEIRLANLHGVDLIPFYKRYSTDELRLHYIRLILQQGQISNDDPILGYSAELLQILYQYMQNHDNFNTVLVKYTADGGTLLLSDNTLKKILVTNLLHPIVNQYDFKTIPEDLVDSVIFASQKDLDISDILEHTSDKSVPVLKLLISLRMADVPIQSFLDGSWNTEQIYALLSGSDIISPSDLIVTYDLDQSYTEGSIREIIRAYSIAPELATLITYKDDDGIPLYNQYQMYEITEGVRLGLDVYSYYSPTNSDLTMRMLREKLMTKKEHQTGKMFVEHIINQSQVELNDDLLDQVYDTKNKNDSNEPTVQEIEHYDSSEEI